MTAHLIDGRAYAAELLPQIAGEAELLNERGVRPCLATLRIGDDHVAMAYEKRLRRVADDVRCHHIAVVLPAHASQDDVVTIVDRLSADPRVFGILLLRPVPAQVSEAALRSALDPGKDVESVHPTNAGLLLQGRARHVPSTPAAAFHLLDRYLADSGRDLAQTYARSNIVIVGRSDNVGKPAMLLGLARDATVVSCDVHSHRAGLLFAHTATADIVMVAAGVPGLIRGEHIKEGAVVIDVGISAIADETTGGVRLVGDVDLESVREKAEAVTPVPGGVGPVTDLCLIRNVIRTTDLRSRNGPHHHVAGTADAGQGDTERGRARHHV